MLSAFRPLLLVPALLAAATASAQAQVAACAPGTRRIELKAELTEPLPELCVGVGLSTLLVFYGAELLPGGVTVKERDKFEWVEAGLTVLRLTPSQHVAPGERFQVTVRFKGEATPVSATFWLVVRPAQAEPLVEVYREARTVESWRQEVKEKEAQLGQCQEGYARLQAEQIVPGGLSGLLASGLLDTQGIPAKMLSESVVDKSTAGLTVREPHSYRSARTVAISAQVAFPEGTAPWLMTEAELTQLPQFKGQIPIVSRAYESELALHFSPEPVGSEAAGVAGDRAYPGAASEQALAGRRSAGATRALGARRWE